MKWRDGGRKSTNVIDLRGKTPPAPRAVSVPRSAPAPRRGPSITVGGAGASMGAIIGRMFGRGGGGYRGSTRSSSYSRPMGPPVDLEAYPESVFVTDSRLDPTLKTFAQAVSDYRKGVTTPFPTGRDHPVPLGLAQANGWTKTVAPGKQTATAWATRFPALVDPGRVRFVSKAQTRVRGRDISGLDAAMRARTDRFLRGQ